MFDKTPILTGTRSKQFLSTQKRLKSAKNSMNSESKLCTGALSSFQSFILFESIKYVCFSILLFVDNWVSQIEFIEF